MTKARDNANGGLGLILIKPSSVVNGTDNGKGTVSFSGVSSVSLNNVFNSTYDNYYLVMNFTPSGSLETRWRGRTNGSDNSSSSYDFGAGYLDTTGGGFNNYASANINYGFISDQGNATGTATMMHIFSPFASRPTTVHSETQVNTEATAYLKKSYGAFNATTSFDGITIYTSTGTFTGSLSVYGYNK